MSYGPCPPSESISDYLLGKLELDQADLMERHLAECENCTAAVERLETSTDALLRVLQAEVRPDAFCDEPQCQQARLRARAARCLPAMSSQGSETGVDAGTASEEAPSREPGIQEMLGDYELLAPIGRGGMGAVWKGRHTKLRRLVALKVIAKARLGAQDAIDRFHREMAAAGAVDHPNVVRAMDAREIDGRQVLITELVEGADLGKLVRGFGPLPVADACEIGRQAALGLEAIHQAGLVHRDVKPSNVMLTEMGTVKILDLGLVLFHNPFDRKLTSDGGVMGTVDYMAPEQGTNSHAVDIRADIYSLGCTLYELLAGVPPFTGPDYATPVHKLCGHARDAAPRIEQLRPDIPDGLSTLLRQTLAKNPADRPDTPKAVAKALEPLAVGSDLRRLARAMDPSGKAGLGVTDESHSTDRYLSSCQAGTASRPDGAPGRRATETWRRKTVMWAAILTALAGSLGAVYTIATNRGVLEIKVFDEHVKVTVSQGGEQVTIVDTQTNQRVRLRAGRYELNLAEAADGLRLSTNQFELHRGETKLVEVRTVPETPSRPPHKAPTQASQPESQRLLDHETFAVAAGGLPAGWRATLGTWETKDHALHAHMSVPYRQGFVFGPQRAWQDYALECEVQVEQGLTGIVFRRNREGTAYGFMMVREVRRPPGSQDVLVEFRKYWPVEDPRWKGEENYGSGKLAEGSCTLPQGSYHRIRIEVVGRRMCAFVGGKSVLQASDPELPSTEGGMGFVMGTSWFQPGIASFRDVKAFQLPADYFGTDDPPPVSGSDAWVLEPAMPVERTSHTASTVGDKIYIIGGDNTWRRVDEFDPVTSRWRAMAEAPEDFRGHAAAVVDREIYVVGGEERGMCSFKKSCWAYDPSRDTWSRKADRPLAATGLAAVPLAGKIIAIGGKIGAGPQPGTAAGHSFDPLSNTWTTVRPLPEPTSACRAAAVGGKVFLFMGVHDDRLSSETWIYDPRENAWEAGVAQPRCRWIDSYSTCAAVDSDQIWIVSGDTPKIVLPEVDIFDCSQRQWRPGPPLPSPRASHSVAVHGNKIYVFGGRNASGRSKTVYSLDWRKVKQP